MRYKPFISKRKEVTIMGRNKEPVKLLQAKGKTHLTKSELEEREKGEVPIIAENISPPAYLDRAQKKKFNEIAKKLKALDIMSDLDCDVLARYIKAEADFIFYENLVVKTQSELLAEEGNEDETVDRLMKYEKLKNTAFNQCHTCASALGMTITSRCKIVVPQARDEPKKNKFERFINSG